jgi:hypothetical protein
MVDGIENPYRADLPVHARRFFGRGALIEELCAAVRAERNSLRAVMGGRGMGKTSLAAQIEAGLEGHALTVIASGDGERVAAEVGVALGVDLLAVNPRRELIAAVQKHEKGRVAVVIDEVETTLADPRGRRVLDHLRDGYTGTDARLALIVLGGTGVYDLLEAEWSPFLRIMGGPIHTLMGLTKDEAAELMRAPLGLDIPDGSVDALWAETAGHPWLLQMVMEHAVEAASLPGAVAAQIPAALRRVERRLHGAGFRPWWSNLRARGQEVYRRVVKEPGAVPRARWASCFGYEPRLWLEVLASTGVVFLDDEAVIARGALFRRWVEENHPEAPPSLAPAQDPLDAWLAAVGADAFERLVVRSLAAWARATVEFPAAAVKHDAHGTTGNPGLHSEAFFQMHAIVALLQHEQHLTAEPEALSMRTAGRSDIKVRSRHDTTRRACVEFKIFGRSDSEVVRQVIGYAAPGDTFAAVVSVDRCKRALRPEFEARCFDGAPHDEKLDGGGVLHPAFYTVHAREGCGPLRVWHFLVQLRDV